MTDNIITLPVVTTLDLPPERVLGAALEQKFGGVVVLGVLEDGSEYFASSMADGAEVLWWLERAKLRLLTVGEE